MLWKTDFLDLLMSDSVQKYSEALELKRKNIPTQLYRYRSLNNMQYVLDEIITGKIYLAHPKELNDPFDSCSILKSNSPSYYFNNKDIFKKSISGHVDEESLSQVFDREDWYDGWMKLVAKESATSLGQEHVMQALNDTVMKEIQKLNEVFNNMNHNMSRLACFTTKSDNLPMWNHYTQNHKGICLEYETKNITDIYILNRLFPVYYSDVLPDIVERLFEKRKAEFSVMDYFLIHKLKDWAYESEWRLIYNAGSLSFSLKDVPEKFWDTGKVVSFIRPSKAILGVNIDETSEALIKDSCKKYNIAIVKMECTEYGLYERQY